MKVNLTEIEALLTEQQVKAATEYTRLVARVKADEILDPKEVVLEIMLAGKTIAEFTADVS